MYMYIPKNLSALSFLSLKASTHVIYDMSNQNQSLITPSRCYLSKLTGGWGGGGVMAMGPGIRAVFALRYMWTVRDKRPMIG